MPVKERQSKLLFSPEEVAEMLGISRCTVYRLMSEGKLKGILVGGRRRFSMKLINDFIEKQEQENE